MINILSKIPFFSNIMNDTFGSTNNRASSSCTEAQFRNVKCHVFQKKKGLRLDFWLEKSIDFTKGSFLSLVAEYNTEKKLTVSNKQEGVISTEQGEEKNGKKKRKRENPTHKTFHSECWSR